MVIRLHFTKAAISALEPEDRRYDAYDDDVKRMAVTVTPNGAKTFYLVKKIEGKVERIRIGRFPDATVSKARKKARELIEEIAVGGNPAEEKRQNGKALTLGELWMLYLKEHAKKKKKSWRYDVNVWDKHLKRWAKKAADSISQTEVRAWHKKIARDFGPYAANRARSLLSSIYGQSGDLIGKSLPNPCLGVKREKERARKRYLRESELKRFLDALDIEVQGRGNGTPEALRLMLFTGLRPRNVLGLRWAYVKMRDQVIVIPAGEMKADEEVNIPMHDQVVETLKRRKGASKRSVYVFPSSGVRGYLYDIRTVWEQILDHAEIEDFQIRDLRRTFATYAGEAGVPWEIIAALLAHSIPGMTGRYSRPTPKRLRVGVNNTVDHMLKVAGRDVGEVIVFPAVG